MNRITLADVIAAENLRPILNDRVPDAWREATLLLRPSDGISTWEFFEVWSLERRLRAVRSVLQQGVWPALVAGWVRKETDWSVVRAAVMAGKPPPKAEKRRPIVIDTRAAHGAQLALVRLLDPIVRKILCPVARGFVCGLRLDQVQRDAMAASLGVVRRGPGSGGERVLTFTAGFTADFQNCFGEFEHDYLDDQINLLRPWAEDEVLDLLKGLVRISTVGEGPRAKGVPQGLVLAPMLANIYLTRLDKFLQASLDALGCIAFRYADDVLVLAQNEAVARKAYEVLETALPRFGRLRLHPEKTRFFSLKNRQNPASWLGIEWWIDRDGEVSGAVPRKRIEGKAAELLLKLWEGDLTEEHLGAVLDSYRSSYEPVLGKHAAEKARRAVQNLLIPLLTKVPPQRDDLHHVRLQLAPLLGTDPSGGRRLSSPADTERGLAHGPLSPLLAQVPDRPVRMRPEGRDDSGQDVTREQDERSASPRGTPPTRGGAATGYRATRSSPSSPTPGYGEGRGRDDVHEEGREAGSSRGQRQGSTGGWPRRSTSPLSFCSPLEARGVPAPFGLPPDPPHAHGRDGVANVESTPQQLPAPAVTVSVQPRGSAGTLFTRYADGTENVARFHVVGSRTHEQVVLAGYRHALSVLPTGVGRVVFRVSQATIENTIYRRDRIGSPAIMTEWARLLVAVDALAPEVGVESVNREGRVVAWRRRSAGRGS